MTSLETSLRAYAEFLEEQSIDFLPDHTPLKDLPVEPSEGDVIMVDLSEKTEEAKTNERVTRNGRFRTLMAAAALIIVACAGAVLFWPDGAEDLDLADVPIEPTEVEPLEPLAVVDRYYQLFASGDIDGLSELIADDADVRNDRVSLADKEDWLKRAAWLTAQGSTNEERSCELDDSTGTTTTIKCSHDLVTAPARPVGLATPIRLTFTTSEGHIVALDERVGLPHLLQISENFRTFLANRGVDVPPNTECCKWDSIEDALAGGSLVGSLVQEWKATVEAEGCQVVDRPCTSETVTARSFVEARGEGDFASITALVAQSEQISDLTGSADDFEAIVRFERAIGRAFEIVDCGIASGSRPNRVTRSCSYLNSNAWSRALGFDDLRGQFDFVFVDGELLEIADSPDPLHARAWPVFETWLRENHPDDVALMLDPSAEQKPLLTDESIALWEQHTSEFVEEAR